MALINKTRLRKITVEGEDIWVRNPTLEQVKQYETVDRRGVFLFAYLVANHVVDENGKQKYTEEELQNTDITILAEVAEAIMKYDSKKN